MTPEQRDKLMQIDASFRKGLMIVGMTVVIGTTLLLIVSFAVAGFKGWLTTKREPLVHTTNVYTVAEINVLRVTNEVTDLAFRAAIAGASLGYKAAERKESWESVSNVLWKHFTE